MKRVRIYTAIIFLTVIFQLSGISQNKSEKYIPIGEAIQQKNISLKLKSLGGHSGECIQLEIINKSKDSLYVFIEPGRRLIAGDSTKQDIFIVRKDLLALQAFEKKTIPLYGFCCESNNGSPYENMKYSIGFMAPKKWVELANFIDSNKFDKGIVQSAVWVLSNNHSLSSVYSSDKEGTMKLRKKLSQLTGQAIPWFNTNYENSTDSNTVFSGRQNKVSGLVDFYVKNTTQLSIRVINEKGIQIKLLEPPAPYNPGAYSYFMDLDVSGWPKGQYYLCVYEDGLVMTVKKPFTL